MARGLRPLFWRSGLMCPGKPVGEIKVHRVYSTQEQSPHHPEQASLYIHFLGAKFSVTVALTVVQLRISSQWPYCLKRCSYCNFNKYIPRSVDNGVLTECLQQEIRTLLQISHISQISSVFFGGGTPSLARASTVAAVLETVSAHARLCDHAEVTLEVNPAPAGRTALRDFLSAGVSRFSIGVQSLNEASLRVLGRDHDPQQALQTLAEARTLCPGRVSVDVMFGIPGQCVASWESELEEVLRVCDDHVSLYQLTLERGTDLYKQVQQRELSMPSDDVTASMYKSARNVLKQAGFLQYEVSNFARHNAVSTHNLGYWRAQPYVGVGPGAHGRFVPRALGMVHREARTQTLEPDVWMREVQQHGHATRRRIQLSQLGLLEEVLVMGLRMTGGISHQADTEARHFIVTDEFVDSNPYVDALVLVEQHWAAFSPKAGLHQVLDASADVRELRQRGVLILDDRGLRCSWEGLALLDSILPVLLLELDMFFRTHRPADGQREK